MAGHPLLVFSHLRWDWVYQRPQHIMSRMANYRHVHYIEEPVHCPGTDAHWEHASPTTGVTVWRPCTPIGEPGFCRAQVPTLLHLVQELVNRENLTDCVAWFYTPMAVPLVKSLQPAGIIYDCMDQLAAFKLAPPEIVPHEAELFKLADVVFTGGPSLFRSKRDRHPNVHCFPSSVDEQHFAQARTARPEPPDQAPLPRPRLGYFGVIDERMDLPLIAALADNRPNWQLVMVGPCTKIDPSRLPRRPNLHYTGQQPYERLPDYLAGWDVCLLPFALNKSTQFISPTKTLEYLAAGKPIVSTPITDVAEPYGDIVLIANTHAEFIRCCERALEESVATRRHREARARELLAGTSWDATVKTMNDHVEQAIRKHRPTGRSSAAAARSHIPDASVARSRSTIEKWPVAIVGAGPTGLSAAYHCPDALLIEKNDTIGGWCRSIQRDGFTWDYAGHIMFSNDEYVHQMYRILLGDNVHWQDREAWIYSKGVYTRYPFQGSLYGLPAQVIKECLIGAIEARFGPLHADRRNQERTARDKVSTLHAAPAGASLNCPIGDVKDCCADGILESTLRQLAEQERATRSGHRDNHRSQDAHATTATPPGNFEEFIYKIWGWGIAKHFAIPYNRKLWGVPLSEMETSWLGGRVPMPDLEEMIEGALQPTPKPMGPNARFGYPLRGGFQTLMNGFLPHIRDRLRLNTAVKAVSLKRRLLTLSDGSQIEFESLISTMPLPVLIRCIGTEAPPEIQRAAAALRYLSVRCVNIGVGREKLTDKHWIYYPEDTVFHRIFVQGNASPHCNPPGGFGLTCEITYGKPKPLAYDGDALTQRCIDDCRRVGIISPDDPILSTCQLDLPHAYVIYDHQRAANVKLIREWLSRYDVILAGRYSEWEYYNSDHAFMAGKRAADAVQTRHATHQPSRAL